MRERCGVPVFDRAAGVESVCGLKPGHKGRHSCLAAVERERARLRGMSAKRSAKRRATETVCSSKGCMRIAPIGSMQCRECKRAATVAYYATPRGKEVNRANKRKRRERKANARYLDLTDLDASCYLCGGPLGSSHIEHIVPVAHFSDYAQGSEEFVSATRLACAHCNQSKHDRNPALFILERWRAGLRVTQAPTVTCAGCPILLLAA